MPSQLICWNPTILYSTANYDGRLINYYSIIQLVARLSCSLWGCALQAVLHPLPPSIRKIFGEVHTLSILHQYESCSAMQIPVGFLHHNNVTNKFMFCWAAMCFSHQRLTLQGDFWSNKLDNAQHHHLKHQMREYLRKNAVHASSKAKQAWGICAEEDGGLFSGQIPYISLVYW